MADQQQESGAEKTVAQSEIGPTTYGDGGKVTLHGPNDPETKAAYAHGDPKVAAHRPAEADAAVEAEPAKPAQVDAAAADVVETPKPKRGARKSAKK